MPRRSGPSASNISGLTLWSFVHLKKNQGRNWEMPRLKEEWRKAREAAKKSKELGTDMLGEEPGFEERVDVPHWHLQVD